MFSTRYDLWRFKYLTRRTGSDKILHDKAFNVAKNPKYDGQQRGLTSMIHKIHKIGRIKNEIIASKELVEELHKQIIRKFEKEKVHRHFVDNIWGAYLADMQFISKFDKGFRFLLCVIDINSKYARVIPLKDKNGITITNVFKKMLNESKCKQNKIRVDKGSKFYNSII